MTSKVILLMTKQSNAYSHASAVDRAACGIPVVLIFELLFSCCFGFCGPLRNLNLGANLIGGGGDPKPKLQWYFAAC